MTLVAIIITKDNSSCFMVLNVCVCVCQFCCFFNHIGTSTYMILIKVILIVLYFIVGPRHSGQSDHSPLLHPSASNLHGLGGGQRDSLSSSSRHGSVTLLPYVPSSSSTTAAAAGTAGSGSSSSANQRQMAAMMAMNSQQQLHLQQHQQQQQHPSDMELSKRLDTLGR